ncbi:MAG: hypothetical protein ACKN9W_03330 [Methylococcus sp.]
MALLLALAAIFYQLYTDLSRLESTVAMSSGAGVERLRAMGQQMDTLRDRLHGLMAESVEIRLKTLDRNIASGKVGTEDLILFQSLQNDLKSLEAYASVTGGAGLDGESHEHARYKTASGLTTAALAQSEMLKEISRLRTLLYLCLTGLVAGGGVLVTRHWIATQRPAALTHPRSAKSRLLSSRRRQD